MGHLYELRSCFVVLSVILTKPLPTPQFAAFREARGSGICMSFALCLLWSHVIEHSFSLLFLSKVLVLYGF